MKIHFYIVLLTLVLTGCIGNDSNKVMPSVNGDIETSQRYILDSVDNEVINEAIFQSATISPSLSHRYNNNVHFTLAEVKRNLKNFVIIDSTYCWENAGRNAIQEHREIDNSDTLWIENLATRNQYNAKISNLPSNYFEYKLFPYAKFDSIFNKTNLGWDYFWKIFEEKKSVLIRVSIPAYNNDRNRAVLYLEHGITGTNGKGNVIWLKRDINRWIAYDIVMIWIS
ncbi:MAG: hypothetical protein JW866_09200 [Ignavibacteriales bacterium]|nr:hypothetical protein [Ignavibacteriales bacterium]